MVIQLPARDVSYCLLCGNVRSSHDQPRCPPPRGSMKLPGKWLNAVQSSQKVCQVKPEVALIPPWPYSKSPTQVLIQLLMEPLAPLLHLLSTPIHRLQRSDQKSIHAAHTQDFVRSYTTKLSNPCQGSIPTMNPDPSGGASPLPHKQRVRSIKLSHSKCVRCFAVPL